MVVIFFYDNKGKLRQQLRRRQRERQKSNKFILVKQQLRASHFFFAHFLAIVAAPRHGTPLYHAPALRSR